jgi:hypothetical protein
LANTKITKEVGGERQQNRKKEKPLKHGCCNEKKKGIETIHKNKMVKVSCDLFCYSRI